MGFIRNAFRNWLEIVPKAPLGIAIMSDEDFFGEVFSNKIWYRGNPAELAQLYGVEDVGSRSFWGAAGSNSAIRKLHSGLPSMMVDVIADIACDDLLGVGIFGRDDVIHDEGQRVWDEIAKANGFGALLKKACKKAVALGDGAFKISFDADLSPLPIIEFYGADRLRFVYERGRITQVVFLQPVVIENKAYTLEESYHCKGISYCLVDDKGELVDVGGLRGFELPDDISHGLGVNLAIVMIFDEHPKYEGRGKSVFFGRKGAFDALDEVMSQWVDALRDGRVQKYIPIGYLPRNPNTGRVMDLSSFQTRFVQTEMDMHEGADNSIKVVQPNIDTSALAESANYFMGMCLQGIIAPATLGLDLQRRDNAKAQREKEKATMYTRGKVVGVLREAVARVAEVCVKAYMAYHGLNKVDIIASVEFGEYAAPNFESQIEAVGKGVAQGIISIENAVEQLYGSSWTFAQKELEVERIKKMKGGKEDEEDL